MIELSLLMALMGLMAKSRQNASANQILNQDPKIKIFKKPYYAAKIKFLLDLNERDISTITALFIGHSSLTSDE